MKHFAEQLQHFADNPCILINFVTLFVQHAAFLEKQQKIETVRTLQKTTPNREGPQGWLMGGRCLDRLPGRRPTVSMFS